MTVIRRDIAVVGGGLAGMSAALGLARAGFDVVLIAPPAPSDARSTALIGSSLDFLKTIDLLDAVRDFGEKLVVMRLIDDTRRLFRAPIIEFHASEICRDCFGINVLNADLMSVLSERVRAEPKIIWLETGVTKSAVVGDCVVLDTSEGTSVRACMVVGADGRRSQVRQGAGIEIRTWSYPQSAIVLNFRHSRDHNGISTEFHTPTGPFTQVPLPGKRSSLVWVESPDAVERILGLGPKSLSKMVEERMHSILGAVEVEDGVQAFPLSGAASRTLTGNRVALIGEAAHVFPPIGAQGLNLGLRDVADLIRALGDHRDDPGNNVGLAQYETARKADVTSRTTAVDLLNRSLLTDFLPVQALRAVGVGALARIPLLRRAVMREGVVPGSSIRPTFDPENRGRAPRF